MEIGAPRPLRAIFDRCLLQAASVFILAGCSVLNLPRVEHELTPEAEELLSSSGIKVSEAHPRGWLYPAFSETIARYARDDATIHVTFNSDCRDIAASFFAIITLGILPAWCPESVRVCHTPPQGAQACKGERYWDEYAGWLVGPLAILPGWKASPSSKNRASEMDRLANDSIITILNQLARER